MHLSVWPWFYHVNIAGTAWTWRIFTNLLHLWIKQAASIVKYVCKLPGSIKDRVAHSLISVLGSVKFHDHQCLLACCSVELWIMVKKKFKSKLTNKKSRTFGASLRYDISVSYSFGVELKLINFFLSIWETCGSVQSLVFIHLAGHLAW